MSLLLDALRKSEAQRRRGQAPALDLRAAVPSGGSGRGARRLAIGAGIALAVLVAAAVLWGWRSGWPDRARDSRPGAPASQPVVADRSDPAPAEAPAPASATPDPDGPVAETPAPAVSRPQQPPTDAEPDTSASAALPAGAETPEREAASRPSGPIRQARNDGSATRAESAPELPAPEPAPESAPESALESA
ncbi:MAG: hypothetical protein RQ847_04805, partial [Wenzhouxiangellaceae bacterium]|nr:hypothetical protein [Wenzhouxiangellaceae bacterium]